MTTDRVDPDAAAQQRLAHVVRTHLHPRLRSEGFARSGRHYLAVWRRRAGVGVRSAGGQPAQHHRPGRGHLPNTVVWPAGTWEVWCAVTGQDPTGRPSVTPSSALFALPHVIDPSVGTEQFEWNLDADTDLDQLGEQLADFAAAATTWGTRLLDPTAAVERLTARGRVWDLIDAVAVLRRADRLHEATPVVEELTRRWSADPRPITLRPHLLTWRREHGLPEVTLP